MRLDGRVVVEKRKKDGDSFDDRGSELGLDPHPVVKEPSLDGFELSLLILPGCFGRPGGLGLDFILDAATLELIDEVFGQDRLEPVRLRIHFEGEIFQMLVIEKRVRVDHQGGRLAKAVSSLFDALFEKIGIDGAFVDVEERDVVVDDLVEQDDELDEVRVGLLPEGLLAFAEEVVQQVTRSRKPGRRLRDRCEAGCSDTRKRGSFRRSRRPGRVASGSRSPCGRSPL